MKLYLMRHGEAESADHDPECGLTARGKSRIEQLAENLRDNNVSFRHIYHSTKKRAQQTAEIMLRIICSDLKENISLTPHNKIKPNDDPALILPEINCWTEDTLVTSHLPFVPNLITLLTGQETYLTGISFETGTIVCLEKDRDSNWTIKWATSPSEI